MPGVSWETALLSLQRIMEKDVHLGGETALEMAGYSHYLSLGGLARVHFYGTVPAWLKRVPTQSKIVVHRRTLLGDDPAGIGDSSRDVQERGLAVNVWRWPIRSSSPERAILEALDELPNKASFDNLGKIFEALTTLRPDLRPARVCAKGRKEDKRRWMSTMSIRFGSCCASCRCKPVSFRSGEAIEIPASSSFVYTTAQDTVCITAGMAMRL